jgi:polyphenol oxidase
VERDGHFIVNARGVRIVVPAFLGRLGLSGGYSVRTGHGSDLDFDLRGDKKRETILANRKLIAGAMAVDAARFVVAEQVHGGSVAVVTAADAGRGAASPTEVIPRVDALVTTAPNVPLVIMSADCVPVLLADENRRAVAVVHSGWPGTVARVTNAAVDALRELAVPPERLYAAIGPCIRQGAYEVGEDVRAKFRDAFTWADSVFTIVGGRWHLDLAGAVVRQLLEAGIRDDRIFDSGLCTVARNDLFYSFRKEGRAAGRMAGVIQINGSET